MCSEGETLRYARRVSGALVDRIDFFVAVQRVPLRDLVSSGADIEPSEAVRVRVIQARELQRARLARHAGTGNAPTLLTNTTIPARWLAEFCGLTPALLRCIRQSAERLQLSARAWHRLLRVARTIADLDGAECVGAPHIGEALTYRQRARDL